MPVEIRDRELYEAYRRFIEDSLEYLRGATAEGTHIPVVSVVVPEFSLGPTGSSVSAHEEERVDWGRIVSSYGEQLRALESLTALIRQFDSKRGDIFIFMSADYLFHSLLRQVIEDQQGVAGSVTAVERTFSQLESYMQSSHALCTGGYVVTGTKLQVDRIDLDRQHSLRQPTNEDLHRYWGKTFFSANSFFSKLMPSDLLLESQIDVPTKNLGGFTQQVSEEAERTLLALRLYKHGRIGLRPLSQFPAVWTPFVGELSGGLQFEAYGHDDYVVTADDASTLTSFWSEFQTLWPLIQRSQATAYDRLMSSYTHRRAIDRLLDILIGLESLYSGGPGSISYKLALRCAVFIGLTHDERRILRAVLDTAYEIRSKVAHGGTVADDSAVKIGGNHLSLADFADTVQRCLARSILAFSRWQLTHGTVGGQLRKEIQDYIDEGLLLTNEIGFT